MSKLMDRLLKERGEQELKFAAEASPATLALNPNGYHYGPNHTCELCDQINHLKLLEEGINSLDFLPKLIELERAASMEFSRHNRYIDRVHDYDPLASRAWQVIFTSRENAELATYMLAHAQEICEALRCQIEEISYMRGKRRGPGGW